MTPDKRLALAVQDYIKWLRDCDKTSEWAWYFESKLVDYLDEQNIDVGRIINDAEIVDFKEKE